MIDNPELRNIKLHERLMSFLLENQTAGKNKTVTWATLITHVLGAPLAWWLEKWTDNTISFANLAHSNPTEIDVSHGAIDTARARINDWCAGGNDWVGHDNQGGYLTITICFSNHSMNVEGAITKLDFYRWRTLVAELLDTVKNKVDPSVSILGVIGDEYISRMASGDKLVFGQQESAQERAVSLGEFDQWFVVSDKFELPPELKDKEADGGARMDEVKVDQPPIQGKGTEEARKALLEEAYTFHSLWVTLDNVHGVSKKQKITGYKCPVLQDLVRAMVDYNPGSAGEFDKEVLVEWDGERYTISRKGAPEAPEIELEYEGDRRSWIVTIEGGVCIGKRKVNVSAVSPLGTTNNLNYEGFAPGIEGGEEVMEYVRHVAPRAWSRLRPGEDEETGAQRALAAAGAIGAFIENYNIQGAQHYVCRHWQLPNITTVVNLKVWDDGKADVEVFATFGEETGHYSFTLLLGGAESLIEESWFDVTYKNCRGKKIDVQRIKLSV